MSLETSEQLIFQQGIRWRDKESHAVALVTADTTQLKASMKQVCGHSADLPFLLHTAEMSMVMVDHCPPAPSHSLLGISQKPLPCSSCHPNSMVVTLQDPPWLYSQPWLSLTAPAFPVRMATAPLQGPTLSHSASPYQDSVALLFWSLACARGHLCNGFFPRLLKSLGTAVHMRAFPYTLGSLWVICLALGLCAEQPGLLKKCIITQEEGGLISDGGVYV